MLPANTLVLITPYGVRKPIQDLKVGDQVVTHTRQQKRINQVIVGEMKNGTLLNIEVQGYTQHIQLSANQQILVYPNLRLLNGKPETEEVGSIADRSFEINWKYANKLETGDYIQLPTPFIRNTVDLKKIQGGELPGVGQGFYAKVDKLSLRPYRGKTYSLTTEEDNSFIARGYTVRT